jgi:hypothetical protein
MVTVRLLLLGPKIQIFDIEPTTGKRINRDILSNKSACSVRVGGGR